MVVQSRSDISLGILAEHIYKKVKDELGCTPEDFWEKVTSKLEESLIEFELDTVKNTIQYIHSSLQPLALDGLVVSVLTKHPDRNVKESCVYAVCFNTKNITTYFDVFLGYNEDFESSLLPLCVKIKQRSLSVFHMDCNSETTIKFY